MALCAIVLWEYVEGETPVDLAKTLEMIVIHDIVEIEAGDTHCYDPQGNLGKREREAAAAEKLFGMLPGDLAAKFHDLWREFEARSTSEARFAVALDRLQPFIQIYFSSGAAWKRHGVVRRQEVERSEIVRHIAPRLWEYMSSCIDDAVQRGLLKP